MHHSLRPRLQEIGVNFLLPWGPSRIMGPGAWGSGRESWGSLKRTKPLKRSLSSPRTSRGGPASRPAAACSEWTTLLPRTHGSRCSWTLLALAQERPGEGPPFLSESCLLAAVFPDRGASALSEGLSLSLACVPSFTASSPHLFVRSPPRPWFTIFVH